MASKTSKAMTVRVTLEQGELLDLLAERHNVDRSEIVRRFLAAGLRSNPLDEEELSALRARKAARARGEVAGLVVPLPPKELVARASDPEHMEKMGANPGARRAASSAPVAQLTLVAA